MYSERPLNPPVEYTTDRSKAVVLILYSSVVYTTRRFMFGLALFFVYVFFCHFSILVTLLGEEETGPCAYRAFVC